MGSQTWDKLRTRQGTKWTMCGILALFGAPGEANGDLRAELLSLSKLLRHRGPDWNGITCFKNCYLAHERLAINGLLSGAQPITNLTEDTALSSCVSFAQTPNSVPSYLI